MSESSEARLSAKFTLRYLCSIANYCCVAGWHRDVHYHSVSELVEMYEWANGSKGMWMSELGFLTSPAYLPNVWLRYLHYIASMGRWHHYDDFVLIWYASWGAGPDAQKCLSWTNGSKQQLTTHGEHREWPVCVCTYVCCVWLVSVAPPVYLV